MEAILSEKDRAVLIPFYDFDPAKLAGFSPAIPLTICSIAVFPTTDCQTLIYVGTDGGKLLLFSLNPSLSTSQLTSLDDDSNAHPASPVVFVRSVTISNRVIELITVLSEIRRVLLLSDGFLFLVDSLLLRSVRKLSFIKDMTAISKRLVQLAVLKFCCSRPATLLSSTMAVGTRSHSEEHHPVDVSQAIQEEQRTQQAQINSLRNDMLSQNKILTQQFLAARDHTQDQQDELRREIRTYMETIKSSLYLQNSRFQKQPDICTGQSSAGILGVSPPPDPAIQPDFSRTMKLSFSRTKNFSRTNLDFSRTID
ncbi:hypothetical protein KSP39_PZI020129 [Platanthera zijinensis]|uniref:Uncharacterized protein n=1 Tax=Platanthera zijinensis TaxID=2320716 RepID=A0AAP0B1N3_9ASPA